MELLMQQLGTAVRDKAVALLAVEDEDVASRSPARLLITAATQHGVETLARRVHATGPRAQFPFVQMWAGDLPVEPELLKEYCTSVHATRASKSGHLTWTITSRSLETSRAAMLPFISSIR